MTPRSFFPIVLVLSLLVSLGICLVLRPPTPAPALVIGPNVLNGIETDWTSARGTHRLWTTTNSGTDYRAWLDEHVVAFTMAQEVLPPISNSGK